MAQACLEFPFDACLEFLFDAVLPRIPAPNSFRAPFGAACDVPACGPPLLGGTGLPRIPIRRNFTPNPFRGCLWLHANRRCASVSLAAPRPAIRRACPPQAGSRRMTGHSPSTAGLCLPAFALILPPSSLIPPRLPPSCLLPPSSYPPDSQILPSVQVLAHRSSKP